MGNTLLGDKVEQCIGIVLEKQQQQLKKIINKNKATINQMQLTDYQIGYETAILPIKKQIRIQLHEQLVETVFSSMDNRDESMVKRLAITSRIVKDGKYGN